MAPPTIVNIPKSDAPKDCSMSLVEISDTKIVITILMYRNAVFFTTLDAVDIILFRLGRCRCQKFPKHRIYVIFDQET